MSQRTRDKFTARQRSVDVQLVADSVNGRGILRIIKAGVSTDVAYFDDVGFDVQGANVPSATSDLGTSANPYRNAFLSGLLTESAADALTGGAAGQSTALALTKEINHFTTVGSGTGAKLPASAAGLTIIVINGGANTLQVYGAGTDTIDDVATATGVAQMVGSTVIYACTVAGKWYSEGLGTGYSGSLQTVAFANALTAIGTNQATGLQLTASVNRVTVGASTTGVNLPASAAGLAITVINSVANSINVYPVIGGSETINGNAAATGVVQMSNSVVTYYSTVAGTWIALGLGSGFAASLPTGSFADALTAVGTTQGTGLQLTAEISRVTTGASTTGVNLPASAPGLAITVINSVAANAIHIYPVQGGSETINGAAAATGIIIGPNTALTFFCTVAGTWITGTSVMPQSQVSVIATTGVVTLTGAQAAGANDVTIDLTGQTGSQALNLPTPAQVVAAIHNAYVGQTYRLRIIQRAAFTATVTDNGASTHTGTATIAQGTCREYLVTLTSLSAVVFASLYSYTVTAA